MTTITNPNYLDMQHPNLIGSKKFGPAALSQPMANAGTDDDADVALRCRVLTRLYAGDNSRVFAESIGIGHTRWNGIENTGALSKDVSRRIWRKYPEVSLDWLWRGRDDALTPARSGELLAAYVAVAAEFRAPQKTLLPARRQRRAS